MNYTYLLRGHLDRTGRLISYPSSNEKKLVALRYLISKFDNGRTYSEREVNDILNAWHQFRDPALLRRELFDRMFFDRKPLASTYVKRYVAVLPEIWHTERLAVADATPDDAGELQRIFNANVGIGALDPTFQEYPLEEFVGLINRHKGEPSNPTELFRLQLFREHGSNLPAGYFHCYYRHPEPGVVLLSMFVLKPEFQDRGLGKECVAAILNHIGNLLDYRVVRINVYVRNWPALRFWIAAGFTSINELRSPKEYSDNEHASLVLEHRFD